MRRCIRRASGSRSVDVALALTCTCAAIVIGPAGCDSSPSEPTQRTSQNDDVAHADIDTEDDSKTTRESASPSEAAELAEPVEPDDWDALDPMIAARIRDALDDVKRHPDDPLQREVLGMVYHANGQLDLARKTYEQVVNMAPRRARSHYYLGIVQGRFVQYDEAVAQMARVRVLEPSFAGAYWQAGLMLVDLGTLNEAQPLFEEATRMIPRHPAPWAGLARIHIARRQFDEAERIIVSRLLRSRSEGYARQLLAAVYRGQGELQKAKVEAARSENAQPSFIDAWLLELQPYKTGFRYELSGADALIEAGRINEAIRRLETLLERWPGDVRLQTRLAQTREAAGDLDASLRMFREIVADHPDEHIVHLNLSDVLRQVAQESNPPSAPLLKESVHYGERAIELNPTYAPTYHVLALTYEALGRADDAITQYESAFELNTNNVDVLLRAALLHIEGGRIDEAITLLERAVHHDPASAQGHIMLGRGYVELGRYHDAERAANEAGKLLPANDSSLVQLRRLIRQGNR